VSTDSRAPRPLAVRAELAALLGAHRAANPDHADQAAELDLDALHGVEVAVSFTFADDILAVWAADLVALRAHRFALGEVVGHCGRLRDRGARGDLIGVAAGPEDMWAIDKRRARVDVTSLCRLEGADIVETVELIEWVRLAAGPAPTSGPPLSPVLHRKPAMADTPGRRVRHGKFGLGTAFAEHGMGPTRKVTCDFPGVGLKVIQARFLEFLD
jgi:hypothetical protein